MERILRVIWIIVSVGLSIFIIIKIIDISIALKYEIEEPLMKGEDIFLLEKGKLFKDQVLICKMFLLYILVSSIFLVRSIVMLRSNKKVKNEI